ncbi:hypothetical protein [Woodsholea maritima]|uniref:hypothetical protein n=1 Tax=Woodsholea maritima TaxID=240237 RepID=UPI0003771EE2|nr:hypothetical protein [Woodsholea maritima]
MILGLSTGSVVFAPLVPVWVMIALGLILAASLGFSLIKRLKGVTARSLLSAGLLLVLANPSWLEEEREALSDIALVVRDDSASMAIGRRQGDAEAALETLRARAASDPSLELIEVSGGASPDGTRLMEPLRQGLGDIPRDRLAGVIMLSDGRSHDPMTRVEEMGLNAPIHHIVVGDPGAQDRRLVVKEAPRYGLVGDPVNFILRVEDESVPEGSATVYLSVDGGEPIEARVAIGEDVNVQAAVQHRGANVVEIEVEPGPNELSLLNNRAAVNVMGVRDRLRVLLVTGEPHNGARAWRDLLKSDPSVDLVHFTILRPLDKRDGVPPDELALIAFPVFELFHERLNEFDLVIFDRYRRRGILRPLFIDNIARYVEGGGALLVTTGPPFAGYESLARSPLAAVLPARPTGTITEQAFTPTISEIGRRHPVTAPLMQAAQSWGRWYRRIDGEAIAGETVLEGENGEPLLVLARQGRGRAAILLSDQAWLWARGFEGGGPHDELFRRTAHWLMGEPELDEERLTAEVIEGRLTVELTTLGDQAPDLSVTWPDNSEASFPFSPDGAGRFKADIPTEAIGLIRLRAGDLTTITSAGPLNPLEYADLTVAPEGLRALTRATGGGRFLVQTGEDLTLPTLRRTRSDVVQFGANWMGLKRNNASIITDTTRIPLMPGLWVALVLMALAGWAWRREGQ